MGLGVVVDKEWRVKKARSTRASQSPFAYKIRQKVVLKYRKAEAVHFERKYSTEVMLKVTGGCKIRQQLKRKLEYDSRDYTLSVMDEEGIIYSGKSDITDAYHNLVHDGSIIPQANGDDLESLTKQTHNMMFSAPKSVHVGRDDILESTRETLQNKYPNNAFLLTYHEDSNNPHVHAILKISDHSGQRVQLRKSDIRELRTNFCQELQNRGYHVTATYRHDLHREKRQLLQKSVTVKGFGQAPYQFVKDKPKSFFVTYQTHSGKEVTLWGKELAGHFTDNQIEIGDRVTIRQGEKVKVQVPMYDHNGTITHYKQAERNSWEVENLSRPEAKHEQPISVPQQVDLEVKKAQQLRNRTLFEEARAEYLHDSGDKRKIDAVSQSTHVPHSQDMPEGLSFKERAEWRKQHNLHSKAQERGIDVRELAENQVMPEGLSFREKTEWRKNNAMLAKAQKIGVPVEQLAENQVMPEGLSLKERSNWRAQNAQLKRVQEHVLKQSQSHGMSLSIKIKPGD